MKLVDEENRLRTLAQFVCMCNFVQLITTSLTASWQFTSARIESSVTQKLDAKVVKTELKNSF